MHFEWIFVWPFTLQGLEWDLKISAFFRVKMNSFWIYVLTSKYTCICFWQFAADHQNLIEFLCVTFSLPVNLNFIKSRLLLHLILQNIFIFVDSRPGWGKKSVVKSEKCHTSVKANSVNPFISYCTRVCCSLSWETSDNPFKFSLLLQHSRPSHPVVVILSSNSTMSSSIVLEYVCWHRRSDDDNPQIWKTITTHTRTSDNLIIHADLSEASSLDLSFHSAWWREIRRSERILLASKIHLHIPLYLWEVWEELMHPVDGRMWLTWLRSSQCVPIHFSSLNSCCQPKHVSDDDDGLGNEHDSAILHTTMRQMMSLESGKSCWVLKESFSFQNVLKNWLKKCHTHSGCKHKQWREVISSRRIFPG